MIEMIQCDVCRNKSVRGLPITVHEVLNVVILENNGSHIKKKICFRCIFDGVKNETLKILWKRPNGYWAWFFNQQHPARVENATNVFIIH